MREKEVFDTKFDKPVFLESFDKKKPLKVLIGLYKGNYSRLFLSALFFFIKHSPYLAIPIVTSNIINIATNSSEHPLGELWLNIIVIAVLLALNIPFHYLHVRLYSKAVRNVEAGLRCSLVKKLQELSIAYHKEMKSGRLQSKIMRDVEAVEMLSGQLFVGMLGIVVNISTAIIVVLIKSRLVFVFFLLSIPVAAATVAVFRGKMKQRNREFREEMEETSARVMEMVELVPITRAHALEDEEVKRMDYQLAQVADRGYKLDVIQSIFGGVSWTVFQVFQMICLAFTGYLAYKGRISIGEVVLYQTYFSTIVNQVSALVNMIPVMAKGFESVNSIGEVLLAHDVEENEGKRELSDVRGEYVFEDACFTYKEGNKPVLNHLNLHIREGETLALVGESGAGKTTILNIILGFDKLDSGRVLLDGNDLKDVDLRSVRKHLAVVPQNTILFSGSIRDNITYGLPDISDEKLHDVIKAVNLEELINELPDGVDTMLGEHGDTLSGGQRQRISIARALIRDPKIIILDEATSALDSISEKYIQSAINNLAKGRTMIVVAHRLSTIRDADRIAVINDGKCTEIGTYEELIDKKGEFYKLNSIQTL
ncbi:MAG: ABC transporter ATP-binding protein [Lachnospiraceae bacterium]|nr:ABC transporter ATP-binding protein [Lachnospiraceae bacterium]